MKPSFIINNHFKKKIINSNNNDLQLCYNNKKYLSSYIPQKAVHPPIIPFIEIPNDFVIGFVAGRRPIIVDVNILPLALAFDLD